MSYCHRATGSAPQGRHGVRSDACGERGRHAVPAAGDAPSAYILQSGVVALKSSKAPERAKSHRTCQDALPRKNPTVIHPECYLSHPKNGHSYPALCCAVKAWPCSASPSCPLPFIRCERAHYGYHSILTGRSVAHKAGRRVYTNGTLLFSSIINISQNCLFVCYQFGDIYAKIIEIRPSG